jgi:hypothetical protein
VVGGVQADSGQEDPGGARLGIGLSGFAQRLERFGNFHLFGLTAPQTHPTEDVARFLLEAASVACLGLDRILFERPVPHPDLHFAWTGGSLSGGRQFLDVVGPPIPGGSGPSVVNVVDHGGLQLVGREVQTFRQRRFRCVFGPVR